MRAHPHCSPSIPASPRLCGGSAPLAPALTPRRRAVEVGRLHEALSRESKRRAAALDAASAATARATAAERAAAQAGYTVRKMQARGYPRRPQCAHVRPRNGRPGCEGADRANGAWLRLAVSPQKSADLLPHFSRRRRLRLHTTAPPLPLHARAALWRHCGRVLPLSRRMWRAAQPRLLRLLRRPRRALPRCPRRCVPRSASSVAWHQRMRD